MIKKPKVFQELERLGYLSPTPFFWTDINCIIIGVNDHAIDLANNLMYKDLIGKSAYDIYTPESAKVVELHIKEVIKSGRGMSFEEELVDLNTLKKRQYVVSRSPLFDGKKVVGVVGCLTEITAQKEAEQLKLENDANKTKLEEQDKFKKIVDQVSHDVRSPLASLQMTLAGCDTILPEKQRLAIRNAVHRIEDIMGNLLSKYDARNSDKSTIKSADTPQPILVSTALLQILTEKRYQYQTNTIEFENDFSKGSSFVCINVQPNSFKRMISNLMNNAIEALEGRQGKIKLILDTNTSEKRVKITIQDTGKGLSELHIDKILNNVAFTEGKNGGSGIGLTQVRDTLQQNNGTMTIDSKLGNGTSISIYFDKVATPSHIAKQIVLNEDDIIIVLDDDESIHGAWDTHFEQILAKYPKLTINHLSSGQETIDFINSLDENFKDRIFLLSDYELIDQKVNGLDVIMQSKVKRKVLVTSHYANIAVLKHAEELNVRILPKQLASDTPIKINKIKEKKMAKDVVITNDDIDLVILDDDEMFVDSVIAYAFSNIEVDKYHDPEIFLQNLHKYNKNTRIIIDYHYYEIENCELDGLMIAKQLHEMGYTDLYLLSGQIPQYKLPDYLNFVLKNNLDEIKALANIQH